MVAVKTLDQLNIVLGEFSTKIEEIRNSPSDVDEAFRKGAIAAAAAEGATFGGGLVGGTVGAVYGAVTEDDFTGSMQRNKEEIKNKIVELLGKLQGAIDGLKAPVAFLQSSGAWLSVQTEINKSRNWLEVKADLRGKWSGSAADSYFANKTLQITAHDTMSANCKTMSDSLGTISDASWEFYSKIVNDLTTFFTDFAAALTKIATGVGAPFGASDAIDALASVIQHVVDYGLTLGDVLMTQKKAMNDIESSIDNPKGFHMNTWPSTGATGLTIDSPNSEKWAAR